ncbi:hypothetical protein [Oryzomonas rubra]|uniref:Uncharacterized protein n=1 Tax=Oryzomonas rubra TaxID=2509454 RepID=A0A5A9X7F6_9BACT|nr:hypothetical protein [Oryzomonas rubra]KAA0888129.1 hypothetical protein ET418_17180 [Oryzomonas rubra]
MAIIGDMYGDLNSARGCTCVAGFGQPKGTGMSELEKVKEELEELKLAVREYQKRPSTDGRPDRQELRRKLAELVAEK